MRNWFYTGTVFAALAEGPLLRDNWLLDWPQVKVAPHQGGINILSASREYLILTSSCYTASVLCLVPPPCCLRSVARSYCGYHFEEMHLRVRGTAG